MTTPAPMPEEPEDQPMEDPVRSPSFWIEQANRYVEIGRIHDAERVTLDGLSRWPNDLDLMSTHSWVLFRNDKLEESSRVAGDVLARAPYSLSALYTTARIALRQGKIKVAFSIVESALSQGFDPNFMALFAAMKLAIREYQEAREAIRKVLAFNPNHVFAQQTLVRLELARKDVSAAVQEAQRLLLLNPEDKTNHILAGQAYFYSGSVHAAEQEFQEALKIDATDAEAEHLLLMAERNSFPAMRPIYLGEIAVWRYPWIQLAAYAVMLASIGVHRALEGNPLRNIIPSTLGGVILLALLIRGSYTIRVIFFLPRKKRPSSGPRPGEVRDTGLL